MVLVERLALSFGLWVSYSSTKGLIDCGQMFWTEPRLLIEKADNVSGAELMQGDGQKGVSHRCQGQYEGLQ